MCSSFVKLDRKLWFFEIKLITNVSIILQVSFQSILNLSTYLNMDGYYLDFQRELHVQTFLMTVSNKYASILITEFLVRSYRMFF